MGSAMGVDLITLGKEYWQPVVGVIGPGGLLAWFAYRRDLTKTLILRVNHLEALGAEERKSCDARIELLNTKFRHAQKNFAQVMLVLRLAPEKAALLVTEMDRILREEGDSYEPRQPES
jgi:hypothetical protein